MLRSKNSNMEIPINGLADPAVRAIVMAQLDVFGAQCVAGMAADIRAKGMVNTGKLLASLKHSVIERNGKPTLQIHFDYYGRILDQNRYVSSKAVAKKVGENNYKDTTFYNKNVKQKIPDFKKVLAESIGDAMAQLVTENLKIELQNALKDNGSN
jgi:hypothetical protein